MKNPNSKFNKCMRWFANRWQTSDTPKGEPRFQPSLLGKDILIFALLPLFAIFFYKGCSTYFSKPAGEEKHNQNKAKEMRFDSTKSQIIDFRSPLTVSKWSGIAKKSAGALVKVKLLNVVETFSTAPVHAQIIDNGLGENMRGGTLIGEGTPDANFERINISFRLVRDPVKDAVAFQLAGRALSLDGTLGLDATKKESLITRGVINAGSTMQNTHVGSDSNDFKDIIFKALTAGLLQEFGSKTQVEKNRSQVLTLTPSTVFFVELMDNFPGGHNE